MKITSNVSVMPIVAPWKPASLPCELCGASRDVRQWLDISRLGDPFPELMPVLDRCPTEGCGTTCVVCRRPPGEVHGPHCWERMRLKVEDPHIVDESDCKVVVVRG